ncbi:MAG: 5'-3' exonuclease H3TH domain-containing protein [Patescibacteria group bacterium]
MAKKLILLDTHALIHRFFHALPPLTTVRGEPVNAVYGIANTVLKILREQKPDYLAACFDRPEKTFRSEAFKEYKIHRLAAVPELIAQFKITRELLDKFKIKIMEMAGYEADDLIGSLVEKFKSEPDLKIIVISGDLDLLQLVDDEKVVVQFLRKGMSDTFIYNEKTVFDRYSLKPKQLPDLKGLLGDASDNIPGVKGIGPKTATPLIQKYGSLENLLENLWEIPDKIGNKLEAQKDVALFSKNLATIKCDVPLAIESLEDLKIYPLDSKTLGEYFKFLGFTSLIGRL